VLGPVRARLIGDMPLGIVRRLGIWLRESLPDRGGDHGVLPLRNVGQGVAHGMNAGAVDKASAGMAGCLAA
jgi:hypothetical protein